MSDSVECHDANTTEGEQNIIAIKTILRKQTSYGKIVIKHGGLQISFVSLHYL